MNNSVRKSLLNNNQWLSFTVKSQVFLLALIVLIMHAIAAVMKVYFGFSIESTLSFRAADTPVLPPGYEHIAVGVHTFGDYLLMNAILGERALANPSFFTTPWPPITYLLFSPFKLLPYAIGLGLFLTVSVFAMSWPVISAVRRGNWTVLESLITVLTVSVFSGPFIMALDRGNTVAFLPTLLFLHFRMLRQGNSFGAVIALVMATIVKPHALFFVLISAIFGDWKIVRRVTFVSGMLHFLGFLISGGGLIAGTRAVVAGMNTVTNDLAPQMSISVLALLSLISPSNGAHVYSWSLVVTVALLLWVVSLLIALPSEMLITRLTLIFTAYPVLIPASPAYNSTVVIALFAIMIDQSTEWRDTKIKCKQSESQLYQEYLLAGFVIFSQLVPIPISFLEIGSIQRPIASSVFLFYLFAVSIQRLFPRVKKYGISSRKLLVGISFVAVVGWFSLPQEVVVAQYKTRSSDVADRNLSEAFCSVSHYQGRSAVISLTTQTRLPTSGGVTISSGVGVNALRLTVTERGSFVFFSDVENSRWAKWIPLEDKRGKHSIAMSVNNEGLVLLIANGQQIPIEASKPLLYCSSLKISEFRLSGTTPRYEINIVVYEKEDPLRVLRWFSIIGVIFGSYVLFSRGVLQLSRSSSAEELNNIKL